MSQKIFEDFNLDEYLVTECDGPGCNKEFRTLIENIIGQDMKKK